jgi:hypothetical protein
MFYYFKWIHRCVIKQYWNVATAVPILSLKCYIQMGNSIDHYITAIGLFNPRKGCLYGLVNCRVDSYQQIMLTNFLCLVHPSPSTYNSNPPVNITINNVDKYIFMCNINIRSVRNKLLNYTFIKISPFNLI